MRTVHNVIYQLTTTRAVLVTFGVLCGGLAFSTFHTYSVAELPQRNLLVMILLVICLVGIGSAVIAPNPVTRSAVGGMVLLHSLLRAYAFGLKEGRDSVGISDFLAHSSPMLVHLLLAYTGLLVWGRARHEAVR